MEWNPSDTVTIGSLLAGLIAVMIFMLRNMGQRTDPALIQLLNKNMDNSTKQTNLFNKLDSNMDKLADTLDKLANNTGNLVTEILKQISDDRRSNLEEHNRIVDKLGDLYNEKVESSNRIIGSLDTTQKSMSQMESSLGEAIHIMADIKSDTGGNGEIFTMLVSIKTAIDSLADQLNTWGEANRQKEQSMLAEIKKQGTKVSEIEKRITQTSPTVGGEQTYMLKTQPKIITSEMKKIGSITQPIEKPIETKEEQSDDESN
jgi:uncharacterized phage infection (PIP) family protein YhgE